MNLKIGKGLSFALLFLATKAFATAYTVPTANESLIGEKEFSSTRPGDTVITFAQRYDLGHNALASANPQLDTNKGFTSGKTIQIPTQHLLPSQQRDGIVINLPEMRMYYYPAGTGQVLTYPIGIGKIGKTIPITRAIITRKTTNPTWTPPEDIREFNLEQGIVLPRVMPPGPDNPLGPYAIYMSIPTYLIHSTIFPDSVGTRASFGCIRMYESDIKDFFPSVNKGIRVAIINSPIKTGWQNNHLYMEAHPALEEHAADPTNSLPGAVRMINSMTANQPTLIDWQLVSYVNEQRDGVPHDVGIKIKN